MKTYFNISLSFFFLTTSLLLTTGLTQNAQAQCSAVNEQDSLALVALYEATDGDNWYTNNWLTDNLADWIGITLTDDGCSVLEIDLSYKNLNGTIPSEIGNLTNLESLRLYGNDLNGTIPPEIGNLTNLESLRLYRNDLSGMIPTEIENLTNLEYLSLFENSFSGVFPNGILNLTNLEYLSLSSNVFSGTIPPEIENLTNLERLYLSSNDFSGVFPPEILNLTNLEKLSLSSNDFSGTIPPEIENLTNLEGLYLNNNDFSGTIIPEIGNLTNLEYLSLNRNDFSGTIPPEIGNLTSLHTLDVSYNNLSGAIPPEMANATNLYTLEVSYNNLSGTIPVELAGIVDELIIDFNALVFSDIIDYYLSPSYFDCYAVPSNVQCFDYSPQAKIPIHTTPDGASLYVAVGDLPQNTYTWYQKNVGLVAESVGDSIFTPTSSGGYACVVTNSILTKEDIGPQNLELSSGFSNSDYFTWCASEDNLVLDSLALVALYNSTNGDDWTNNTNWLTGNLDTWHGIDLSYGSCAVRYVYLEDNNLVGTLPPELGNLNNVEIIRLGYNEISGTIPAELIGMSSLEYIYAHGNNLSGVIPGVLSGLIDLSLEGVSFQGNSFIFSDFVEIYDAWYSLQGSCINNPCFAYTNQANIPTYIADDSTYLYVEAGDMDNNTYTWYRWNEYIPIVVIEGDNKFPLADYEYDSYYCKITSSYINTLRLFSTPFLWQSSEEFACNASLNSDSLTLVNFYNLTAGENWNNNTNWLTGSLNNWQGVTLTADGCSVATLSLPNNNITGSLPPQLGTLKNLSLLNLSNNQLAGTIPVELGDLNNLSALWLNQNQLTGTIPSELGNLTNLTALWLNQNQLTGTIPPTLGNLENLSVLWLNQNQLTGTIPQTFSNLTNLNILWLHNNQLSSNIPPLLGNLNNLVELNLSNNEFGGAIPTDLSNLNNLVGLYLNDNLLTGCVPDELAIFCTNFITVNISNNLDLATQNWTAFCAEDEGACSTFVGINDFSINDVTQALQVTTKQITNTSSYQLLFNKPLTHTPTLHLFNIMGQSMGSITPVQSTFPSPRSSLFLDNPLANHPKGMYLLMVEYEEEMVGTKLMK